MTVLMIPDLNMNNGQEWPTLGPQVCAWIEEFLVFGPGDLRGEPAVLDAEKRALIYRMYEIWPKGSALAGRRRFKRVALSLRKGTAKTELAAWLAAVEIHPDGPVRCDGFDARGQPVGVGVTDPYIPLVAYTEEQSDELAYGALKVILEHSPLAGDFDIGLERIMRAGGDGKAVSLATSPSARDGARTTFQVFDETHRFTSPRLRAAHRTMQANIFKRKIADAWSCEITTAYSPGEGSIAEDTMDYARMVRDGKVEDSRLFFFHRQAGDEHDLETAEGVRAAVIEASGPAVAWSDIDGIASQWSDPTTDKAYLQRVWLNQIVRATKRAFDVERWAALADTEYTVPPKAKITLGFDGARWRDSTALVGTEIATGFQWLVAIWERPENVEEWEVAVGQVDAAVAAAFEQWDVWRLYADPPYWESLVSEWAGRYGEDRVVEWWTNRQKAMAYALKAYSTAITGGELSHDGNAHLKRHVGNACRHYIALHDPDTREPMWLIYKEQPESPHKIDGAMAGCLSWEARNDAVAAGVGQKKQSAYETRGLVVA
jgi:phage terminase large subunit-like protein